MDLIILCRSSIKASDLHLEYIRKRFGLSEIVSKEDLISLRNPGVSSNFSAIDRNNELHFVTINQSHSIKSTSCQFVSDAYFEKALTQWNPKERNIIDELSLIAQ